MKEIVICAAIKTKSGTIVRGQRHCDAIATGVRMGISVEEIRTAEQGFVTSRNRFVDRKEAYRLQVAAGIQSADPYGYRKNEQLYSEDLYLYL